MSEQTVDTNNEQAVESVDVNRLEGLLTDLSKAISEQPADPSIEIISKGADAIVAENKALAERIEKSMELMNDKFNTLLAKFDELQGLNDKMEKGFSDLASQPLPSKAITVEAEVAPAETVAAPVMISKSDILSKAITELSSCQDPSRLAQLRKGIAQLESNFAPADVAASLSL